MTARSPRGRALLGLLVLAAAVTAPGAAARAAEPGEASLVPAAAAKQAGRKALTPVRGTRISLIVPEGFVEAARFPGFEQPGTGASIMVTELPGPYSEISKGMSADQLRPRGMTLLRRAKVSVAGRQGLLVLLRQKAFSQVLRKWLAVFGDDRSTTLITATFPEALSSRLSVPLKGAVLSAAPGREADLGGGFGFSLPGTPALKLAGRVANLLAYTPSGVFPPAEGTESAFFLAGPSLSAVPITDRRDFARKRLLQTAQVRDLRIETLEPVTIDGLEGFEIVARGADVKDGHPVAVYQTMLFDEKGYYLLTGMADAKVADRYLGEFRTLARGFRLKRPASKE